MKCRVLPCLWLSFLLIVAGLVSSLRGDEPKSPLARLNLATGDTIVFLGDSITHQCLYTQYVENYFYTRYPKMRLNFFNAGVSGDTAADALARFDRDVAVHRPKYVTVLLGMNDGASKRFEEKLFTTYQEDMHRLIEKIRAIGATPIVITPTMYDLRSAQQSAKADSRGRGGYFNGVLALYGAWLRELAVEEGLGFVDMYSQLNYFTNQSRKTDPKFTLIPDGIHPDANGQIVMAYALVSDLGLSRRASTIDIARAADSAPVVKASGGKVSDPSFSSEGSLEFTFQPDSLPMPVPVVAKLGAKLILLGHRLGLEALYVHGLAPGSYQLSINDQPVGVYSASTLESKLELQNDEKTPQYKQAMRVADLNAQRNEQAVVSIRNLWRSKKALERTKRELELSPDDEVLKKRKTSLQRSLGDFDAKKSYHEGQAKQIEDQIYQANQPEMLHYRLQKVEANKP